MNPFAWPESKKNPMELPGLTLAYIGDAVWEVYVRQFLVFSGETRPHRLHKRATGFVKAKAQSDILFSMMDELSEEEQSVVRRGRNAKSGTIPKNADVMEYKQATAFESLMGYLYLAGHHERLQEIAKKAIFIIEGMDHRT